MLALLLIARHEAQIVLRTRRALGLLVLYLGVALLGGLAYVLVVRLFEQQVREALANHGEAMSTALLMQTVSEGAYQQMVAFFAGVPVEEMAPYLLNSTILPVLLWSSLAFLPFLILLTSFDQMASDLAARSVCYSVLRARRAEILLGKALAHLGLIIMLSAVAALALVVIADALLETVRLGDSLGGLALVWLMLIPFAVCYVGIASFASTTFARPFGALVLAFGIIIGLRAFAWFRFIPESSPWHILTHLRWLSPSTYESDLWRAGLASPATSAAAYLAFGAVFALLAIWRLGRRDL